MGCRHLRFPSNAHSTGPCVAKLAHYRSLLSRDGAVWGVLEPGPTACRGPSGYALEPAPRYGGRDLSLGLALGQFVGDAVGLVALSLSYTC